MAVLDVLNLNLGTEQNPNWVLHDLHDKRISTTAATTATHLLATNAGVTAINPMTIANAASVLGVVNAKELGGSVSDFNSILTEGTYSIGVEKLEDMSNKPAGLSSQRALLTVVVNNNKALVKQTLTGFVGGEVFERIYYNNVWQAWSRNDNYGTASLSELASALGVGNCVKVNQYVVDQTRNISSQTPLVISFTVSLSTKGQVVLCLSRNFFNKGVTAFITLGYNDAHLSGSVIANSGSEDLSIEFEAVPDNSIKVTCTALSGNAFGRLVATEIQKVGDVSYN